MISEVSAAIEAAADPERAAGTAAYFQVRPGGYGEGDRFVGVSVGQLRAIVKPWTRTPFHPQAWLGHLRHPVHEHRLAALIVMAARAGRGDAAERELLATTYLGNTDVINNWDLVDVAAGPVIGGHLLDRPTAERRLLDGLAASPVLWERRTAIVATHQFLRAGQAADSYRVAELLLDDSEDLMHKAVGWTLREAGKRVSADQLRSWLGEFGSRLPRTALRYAIEHFPAEERREWLAATR